ncbi:MAG TPA: hypothetical protein VF132_11745 [Rudaea sp.]
MNAHRLCIGACLVLLLIQALPALAAGVHSGFRQLALGNDTTCASRADRSVTCWGVGARGQLGDALFTTFVDEPVEVIGRPFPMERIAAGDSHVCGVGAAGGVSCWGWNGRHQISSRSDMAFGHPADPVWISARALAAGGLHSCALAGGSIQCWGDNDHGQLSTGDTIDRVAPADVVITGVDGSKTVLTGVASVATGPSHTCAVLDTGEVLCWGANEKGQLGCGDLFERHSPVYVTEGAGTMKSASAVVVGDAHTCALLSSGFIKCWGSNDAGQLGISVVGDKSSPALVFNGASPISDAIAIAAGARHTCAVRQGGTVFCWGDNTFGQIGTNDGLQHYGPAAVVDAANNPITGMQAVAAGAIHTCAQSAAGLVLCWGDDTYGELGNGYYGAGLAYGAAVRAHADPTLFVGDFD